jgi:acetyl-CoA C-acetyltransferase
VLTGSIGNHNGSSTLRTEFKRSSSMSSQRSVVFAEPVRTAIGAFGGAFKDIPAPDLGAAAIKAAVARAGLRHEEIEIVIIGNVVQAGVKMNPARQAAIRTGLPVATPALTVNRVCGSGAQAIVSASQEILLGNIHVAVTGGKEAYGSRALPGRARPMGQPDGRWPAL